MRKQRQSKAMKLKMGGIGRGARHGPRDGYELPPFVCARAPQHSKIPGRGSHKAKPGR